MKVETARIQSAVRKAANTIVLKFSSNPFVYFREPDSIFAFSNKFRSILKTSGCSTDYQCADGTSVQGIHHEYRTFAGIPTGKPRNLNDLVLLDPQFILKHHRHELANPSRLILDSAVKRNPVFQAVVEFKLLYQSLNGKRVNAIVHDLKKLIDSERWSSVRCMILFIRQLKPMSKSCWKYLDQLKEGFNLSGIENLECFSVFSMENEKDCNEVKDKLSPFKSQNHSIVVRTRNMD